MQNAWGEEKFPQRYGAGNSENWDRLLQVRRFEDNIKVILKDTGLDRVE